MGGNAKERRRGQRPECPGRHSRPTAIGHRRTAATNSCWRTTRLWQRTTTLSHSTYVQPGEHSAGFEPSTPRSDSRSNSRSNSPVISLSRQLANPLVMVPADGAPDATVGSLGGWRVATPSVPRRQPPGRCHCGRQGERQTGGRSQAGDGGTLQLKAYA